MIKENDEESSTTEKKDLEEIDSDEELGRSEDEINLANVSVKSTQSKKSKAILSPEEVKKIQEKAEAEEEHKRAVKEHEEQAIKLNMKTQ